MRYLRDRLQESFQELEMLREEAAHYAAVAADLEKRLARVKGPDHRFLPKFRGTIGPDQDTCWRCNLPREVHAA